MTISDFYNNVRRSFFKVHDKPTKAIKNEILGLLDDDEIPLANILGCLIEYKPKLHLTNEKVANRLFPLLDDFVESYYRRYEILSVIESSKNYIPYEKVDGVYLNIC